MVSGQGASGEAAEAVAGVAGSDVGGDGIGLLMLGGSGVRRHFMGAAKKVR